MPTRRRISTPLPRATARDAPKSLELEQRIARLELHLRDLLTATDIQAKRVVALQAQLDHLAAKLGRI